MAISYDLLAPAVYMICLLWLAIIAALHLMPRSLRITLSASVWWLILVLSFYVIFPEFSSTWSGYALLPIATLAAAIASVAGLRSLWWRLIIAALPAAVIIAGADYLPLTAIAAVLVTFVALASLLHRWLRIRQRPAVTMAATAALCVATIAALISGAPLIFATGLISISAHLAAALIPVRNGDRSWQDRVYHLAITVPAILALEWVIFGY